MKNKRFIGIDVSKDTLDVYLHQVNVYFVVPNTPNGFSGLLETSCKHLKCKLNDLYFCFENTGRYSRLLAVFLSESDVLFTMAPAMDIKRSMGMKRGKTDRLDAKAIALYAWRKRDELIPTRLNSGMVAQLRQLLALREKLVRHRTAYKNSIKDIHDSFFNGETTLIKESQKRMIEHLNTEINLLESKIEEVIMASSEWNKNYKLIQSVRGIGPVLAKYIIIYTENFTRINNAKSFACYSGIAPFEYSSGSTIRGRTRVHPFANRQLKSLLNIAAMGAIQLKGEYKTYYQRRTDEGKNKMSTLNIIRNKLVSRIFAVVNRQTPYVDLSRFTA
ncbi:IS110 family transposase [Saccharicrinis sp. FJH54]|uniref:IS110 family transposase n=1 Tax=Saccharicrinis sp. FJH54 TaxID=3344665 RepID=UPI0035D4DCD6